MLCELNKSQFQNEKEDRTSARNKCSLMFIGTSGLLLMFYCLHILTRAAVVISLQAKTCTSHLMPVTARTKRILSQNNFRPQIPKTLYPSNIRGKQFLFFLEAQHSLAVPTIQPLSFCLLALLALRARRKGRRSPTWHKGRMIPEQPVNFTP